jgi:hypothetical protein
VLVHDERQDADAFAKFLLADPPAGNQAGISTIR